MTFELAQGRCSDQVTGDLSRQDEVWRRLVMSCDGSSDDDDDDDDGEMMIKGIEEDRPRHTRTTTTIQRAERASK